MRTETNEENQSEQLKLLYATYGANTTQQRVTLLMLQLGGKHTFHSPGGVKTEDVLAHLEQAYLDMIGTKLEEQDLYDESEEPATGADLIAEAYAELTEHDTIETLQRVDKDLCDGQLALAATACAFYASSDYNLQCVRSHSSPPKAWPFSVGEWDQIKGMSRIEILTRAGAYLAADIDRLVRQQEADEQLEETARACEQETSDDEAYAQAIRKWEAEWVAWRKEQEQERAELR